MRMLRFGPFALLGALLALMVFVGPARLVKLLPLGGGGPSATNSFGSPSAPATGPAEARSVAITGIQKVMGIAYTDGACPKDRSCLHEAREVDGYGAAYFDFTDTYVNSAAQVNRNYACTAYLLHFVDLWDYIETACSGGANPPRATAPVPKLGATVPVFVLNGCANVRQEPGLLGAPKDCLANGTVVSIDGGPRQVDSRLWWHLKGLGWMTHDVLLPPDQSEAHSILDDVFPHGDSGYVACGSTGDLSACPFTTRLRDRLQQTQGTLCRCQAPVCCRTVGIDLRAGKWLARVQMDRQFILTLIRENGRFLIDDEVCSSRFALDGDPGTSIYATTAPCPGPS